MSITYAVLGSFVTALVVASVAMTASRVAAASSGGAAGLTARERNVRTMLAILRGIEERDPNRPDIERQLALVQPDVEMHWPQALPYGGTFRGFARRNGPTWDSSWTPLQPTIAERRMDPRVIGADDHEVAILYHQRGLNPSGERFDGEVLGLYELRDAKLARAQMFYFDEAAAVSFLARAASTVR